MDRYSISDSGTSPVVPPIPAASATRPAIASVSAGIADANIHLSKLPESPSHFPREDSGRSLADIAQDDLDAALQLLAERAQYITAASGAAIALRRGEHHDMLCRASAGGNAPELGALLSMDYGLSGESVRTRQVLRCDDAARDSRVNHAVCRQLGIASVVVMPIVSDDQVLGVFELLSGKPRAFEERDLSALRRLSEMVEVAIKHAVAAHTMPDAQQPPVESAPIESAIPVATTPADIANTASIAELAPALPDLEKKPPEAPKKPLFWSAATQPDAGKLLGPDVASSAVPPGLRNLQKCQACGFPVSQGRTYCVECEEKQWRGQPLPKPSVASVSPPPADPELRTSAASSERAPAAFADRSSARSDQAAPNAASVVEPKTAASPASSVDSSSILENAEQSPSTDSVSIDSALFLSSNAPTESWVSANKFVLIALLAVAIVIAAVYFLR